MKEATVRLTVPADADGSRLDRFLAAQVRGRTRSALRRLILEGRVRVDGQPAPKPGLGLQEGMAVELDLPVSLPERPLPEAIPLEVLHEDPHLLVVNKPAGLVVHPGHGRKTGTLVNALLGRGTPLAPAGGTERPGVVHRLDRDTSGLVIVAKTDEAHRGLGAAFARREIAKVYVALVWGHPSPPGGTIERAIGRSRANRTRMTVHTRRGRLALTEYRTLESLPGFALLEVRPRTGRTHQIRVHFQSIHHPIVGDAQYGGRQWKSVQDPLKRRTLREFARLGLHASELAFTHPVTGRDIRFRAPLPADFQALLRTLRGST